MVLRATAFVLAASLCGGVVAQGGLPINDPSGLDGALESGDREAVRRALDASAANPVVRDLSHRLLDGNLEDAERYARRCARGALDGGAVPAAVRCQQLLAGLLLRRGDIASWAQEMVWAREVALPALQRFSGQSTPITLSTQYQRIDFDQVSSVARLEVVRHGEPEVVEIYARENSPGFWAPVVTIAVNGRPIEALIDTGSDMAISISLRRAAWLGLETVVDELNFVASTDAPDASAPGASRFRPDHLALADSIAIGPLELRNVGVFVTNSLTATPFDVVVGLHALNRMPQVNLTRETLEMRGEAGLTCDAPQQMTFSSASDGGSKPYIATTLAGSEVPAFIDTGDDQFFRVQGPLAARLLDSAAPLRTFSTVTSAGTVDYRGAQQRLSVRIGDREVTDDRALVVPDTQGGAPMTIGSGLLNQHRLEIDFSSSRACIVRLE